MKQIISLALIGLMPLPASAGKLDFEFQLPSFGGNPLASSYYLAMIESQKQPQEKTAAEDTQLQRFQEDLERRLLTTLASTITTQIFGDDATPEGSFSVGDLDINYATVGDDVRVTLTDGVTTTEIVVPGL